MQKAPKTPNPLNPMSRANMTVRYWWAYLMGVPRNSRKKLTLELES